MRPSSSPAGKPIELVPHRRKNGLWPIAAFKRKHEIRAIVTRVADDFDASFQADFLLRPPLAFSHAMLIEDLRLVTVDRALMTHPLAWRAN